MRCGNCGNEMVWDKDVNSYRYAKKEEGVIIGQEPVDVYLDETELKCIRCPHKNFSIVVFQCECGQVVAGLHMDSWGNDVLEKFQLNE